MRRLVWGTRSVGRIVWQSAAEACMGSWEMGMVAVIWCGGRRMSFESECASMRTLGARVLSSSLRRALKGAIIKDNDSSVLSCLDVIGQTGLSPSPILSHIRPCMLTCAEEFFASHNIHSIRIMLESGVAAPSPDDQDLVSVDIDVAIHGTVSMHSGLLHGEEMMSTSWVSISVIIITCLGVLMAHGQETLPSCDTSDDDHCGTPYGQLHQHY